MRALVDSLDKCPPNRPEGGKMGHTMFIGGQTDLPHTKDQLMTQKQLLTGARKVMIGADTDVTRTDLKRAARDTGRGAEAVNKASTMRLAMWVSKGTSAI